MAWKIVPQYCHLLPEISSIVKYSGPLLKTLNGIHKLDTPLSDRQFFLRFKYFKLQKNVHLYIFDRIKKQMYGIYVDDKFILNDYILNAKYIYKQTACVVIIH